MTQQLIFPLQFKRQFAGPIDGDSVFDTEVNMTAYLESPLRYPGQIVSCLDKPESIFKLNTDGTAWKEFNAAPPYTEFIFESQSEVTIEHNFGKYPSITILVNNEVVEGKIVHTDKNNLVVTFNQPLSGIIVCK